MKPKKLIPAEVREIIGMILVLTATPVGMLLCHYFNDAGVCQTIIQLIVGVSLFNNFNFLKDNRKNER